MRDPTLLNPTFLSRAFFNPRVQHFRSGSELTGTNLAAGALPGNRSE
jgi:hypothetical protein